MKRERDNSDDTKYTMTPHSASNQGNLPLVDQLASSRLQELASIEAMLETILKSAHELLLAHDELAELIRQKKDNLMVTMSKVNPPLTKRAYVFSFRLYLRKYACY